MLSRPAMSNRRRAFGAALCGACAVAVGACTSVAQPPRVVTADSSDAPQRQSLWRALDPAFCQRLEFLNCKEAATAVGDSPNKDEAARLGLHLVLALQNGDIEQARRHIGAGADVDFFLPGDGTPLVIAAQYRDYAITRLLLEAGADANRFAPGDGAPLVIASAAGDFGVVELLVAHDADVNAYRTGDETPLIRAARNNHTSVARHLLEHGADANLGVDVRTWLGAKRRTPLGEATREHHREMVRLLREYGATL
jgi:ankyrin repeat protein